MLKHQLCAAVALAASAVLTPAFASAETTPDIVGGHPATENYGWVASLQVAKPGDPDFHRCTATLRSSRAVRINAHCVTKQDGTALDPALFHIRVGSNDRRSGGYVSGVSEVIPVPLWQWGKLDDRGRVNDDAILILSEDVPVPDVDVDGYGAGPGDQVREMGWGSTDPSGTGQAAVILQELDTTLAEPSRCNDPEMPLAVGEVCVDNPGGVAGSCYGDSGGPLVREVDGRWVDMGGASRNVGTDPRCGVSPTIYTDVRYYVPWEDAVMEGVDPLEAMGYLDRPEPRAYQFDVRPSGVGASGRWAAQWALTG